MSRVHGHIVRFCVIDCILLLMLLLTGFGGSLSTLSLFMLLAALVIIPLSIVSIVMLYRKSTGGLNVGIANLSLTGSYFLLIGVLGLYFYANGSEGNILLPIALSLLGISTLRRVSTMRNPAYSTWYQSYSNSSTIVTGDNEVMTLCPGCSSILAVIPSKLSPEDLCPNCDCELVSIEESD